MRRRDILGALGSAVILHPVAARAQATPVIGFLHSGSMSAFVKPLAAFHRGLNDGGFSVGRNVVIDYGWADGQQQRLPELAAEFVRRNVAAIAAIGGNAPALAAKAATSTIPIVFNTGADPVAAGLVSSFNRPGGNVTGVSFLIEQLGEKGFALLHEIVPNARKISVLINPENSGASVQISGVREAASKLGLEVEIANASTNAEIDRAFGLMAERNARALLISGDPFLGAQHQQIIALAARNRIPTMYFRREFVEAGGLVSYGTSANEAYSKVGEYLSLILKGARPGDLPVSQVVKFELVVNLKTARSLGVDISPSLSARADDVIE